MIGWLCGSLGFEALCIVSAGSPSSGLGIERHFFVRFLIHQGIFMVKFHIFFINLMNRLGTGSIGGLVAAPFYKCFILFQLGLPHPSSELSTVSFFRFLIL